MDDLGLYIHVPFCKHACPYCDFYKIELRSLPASTRLAFTGFVQRELELLLHDDALLAKRDPATIYFGGGTPSTLKPEFVASLVEAIRETFAASVPEVTLEANPENLTAGRCEKWRAAGITRLSIGAQTFDDAHLQSLERLHQSHVIDDAVANARGAGFDNISIDLMFALPGQTMEQWKHSLRRAIDLAPDHVSFYGLTYHEGTPFHESLRRGVVAETGEDLQAEMYLFGSEFLRAIGFEHYEISNFAKPGKRSAHNQRYWTRRDVLGVGPGAHSNVGAMRWRNPDDLEAWQSAVEKGNLPRVETQSISIDLENSERLFTALRRVEGISAAESPALFASCAKWFRENAKDAARYAVCDANSFRLTVEGWLISDLIIRQIEKLRVES